MTKPWSMARFIAQPPRPRSMTYMEQLRIIRSDATDLMSLAAIFVWLQECKIVCAVNQDVKFDFLGCF